MEFEYCGKADCMICDSFGSEEKSALNLENDDCDEGCLNCKVIKLLKQIKDQPLKELVQTELHCYRDSKRLLRNLERRVKQLKIN